MRRSMKLAAPVAAVALGLLLAACAKSGSAASGSPGGGSTVVVNARSISGLGSVLVNPSGLTLYHLPSESASSITCTGTCATSWPPFLLPTGDTGATGASGVSGTFGTAKRPDGAIQVTYNGMPLYTFDKDTAPGQATGQNVEDFVVVSPGASGGSSGSTAGKGGYGY
jgi:predicted lipoprotein with Yx(FWY)xxD motif